MISLTALLVSFFSYREAIFFSVSVNLFNRDWFSISSDKMFLKMVFYKA